VTGGRGGRQRMARHRRTRLGIARLTEQSSPCRTRALGSCADIEDVSLVVVRRMLPRSLCTSLWPTISSSPFTVRRVPVAETPAFRREREGAPDRSPQGKGHGGPLRIRR
jgi:hypothetical protein